MQTYFIDLVSRGPVLIDRDLAVSFLSDQTERKARLNFTGIEPGFGLVPGGNLEDVLRIYCELKHQEIEEFKKEFIKKNIDFPLLNQEERQAMLERRKVIKFIMEELIPFVQTTERELVVDVRDKKILTEEQKEEKIKETELSEILKKKKEELSKLLKEDDNSKTFKGKNEISYLKSLIPLPCFIFEGIVYGLKVSQHDQSQILIFTKNNFQSLSLELFSPVLEIEKKYQAFFEWHQKKQAIEDLSEYVNEICKNIIRAKYDLDELVKYSEFCEGRIGFIQKEGQIFVYKQIPRFAMMDPRKEGTCYKFPECKVCCKLHYSGDNLYVEGPFLVEKFVHPFSNSSSPGNFQQICGMKLPATGVYSNPELVSRALDMTENLITNGLTPDSIRKHTRDNGHARYNAGYLDNIIEKRKITVEEAKEKGFLLTNNWKW